MLDFGELVLELLLLLPLVLQFLPQPVLLLREEAQVLSEVLCRLVGSLGVLVGALFVTFQLLKLKLVVCHSGSELVKFPRGFLVSVVQNFNVSLVFVRHAVQTCVFSLQVVNSQAQVAYLLGEREVGLPLVLESEGKVVLFSSESVHHCLVDGAWRFVGQLLATVDDDW